MRETKRKLIFACQRGLYQHNVRPFGLDIAPGIFQVLMSIVLYDLGDFAMAYLDVIIKFIVSEEEHD